MAGHSKWKNTKHRKIIQDVKRGKIFNKLVREVKTAAKLGGENIAYNSRLRVALEKALSQNMAKGTFNRLFSQNVVRTDTKKNMEDVIYEGYGPGGTALLLKCFTNNKNRIVSEVRHALSVFDGNLGTNGSVSYLFNKKGVISCFSSVSEDIVMNAALKVGADDISVHSDGIIKIYISSELLCRMESELKSFNIRIYESKILMKPCLYVNLDEDNSLKLLRLIDMLKDINDVYAIYHNGELFKN